MGGRDSLKEEGAGGEGQEEADRRLLEVRRSSAMGSCASQRSIVKKTMKSEDFLNCELGECPLPTSEIIVGSPDGELKCLTVVNNIIPRSQGGHLARPSSTCRHRPLLMLYLCAGLHIESERAFLLERGPAGVEFQSEFGLTPEGFVVSCAHSSLDLFRWGTNTRLLRLLLLLYLLLLLLPPSLTGGRSSSPPRRRWRRVPESISHLRRPLVPRLLLLPRSYPSHPASSFPTKRSSKSSTTSMRPPTIASPSPASSGGSSSRTLRSGRRCVRLPSLVHE